MLAERKTQVEALLPAIERFSATTGAKTKILCGDFNDDPDSPALCKVVDRAAGFHDTYAEYHGSDPGLTWALQNPYVDPAGSNRDQRIDYIFTSGDLRTVDCSVVFDGKRLDLASDHFGVFCNLEFR